MDSPSTEPSGRQVGRAAFDRAYRDVVLGNHFFEQPEYYRHQQPRYRRTLGYLADLSLPRPARILEIGGGQVLLLCHRLFGDQGKLADVSDEYADAVTRFGLEFTTCDLLYDDLPEDRGTYDLVVICEVIEHLPVPPYLILRKVRTWIRPGGYVLVTTPNLYRLRNAVRLALGMPLFCPFFYPQRGRSLGHPLEYSREHLRWQLEQAGFEVVRSELAQLSNVGSTLATRFARMLMTPLLWRSGWRDSLVAIARSPVNPVESQEVERDRALPPDAPVSLREGT